MNFKTTFFALPLLLAACGPIRNLEILRDNTKEMNESTKDLNKGMKKTNDATHLFAMTVALQQLTAKENTETLTPPARMLPFAHGFAEEASALEIIETFHTFWTDVRFGGATDKAEPTADDVRLKSRLISMAAASAIAALTSPEKFAEILRVNIDGKSRFEETAYAFALCRYNFIRDFMFASIVDNARDVNLDSLSKAATYYSQMKQIVDLPYVAKMDFPVSSFSPKVDAGKTTFEDVNVKIDRAEVAGLARSATRRFQRDLPADVQASAAARAHFNQLR